jgi:LysR family transcriptional regulator, hydrogen peroxide-inducible genes activator
MIAYQSNQYFISLHRFNLYKMTLQQFEYIVAVDQCRHFAKAAEECKVTQPTLSMMIQKLEDELGLKIFNRSKHPVEPTQMGEEIIVKARNILLNAARLKEYVHSEKDGLTGALKLAVIPTVAPYLLPRFFPSFTSRYPEVDLKVSEIRTDTIIEYIVDGKIDAALLATPLHHDKILEIPLYYEKFVGYVSPTAPFYNDETLTSTHLPLKDLWVLQEGHCLRNQVFNFCEENTPRSYMYEAGSIDTLIRIVDTNGGYTVIPELHLPYLTEEQHKNVRPIVGPEAVREISLVIHPDFVREKVLNAVADTIKSIIPSHMLDSRLKKFTIKL